WTAPERVGLDRALEAYTVGGARAWHLESSRGRLAPGTDADLVVWSGDLYDHAHDPSGLLREHAELTIVGGRLAHSAGALSEADGAVGDDPVAAAPARDRHVHAH
ncbi:amidohydrolase family protein, partial [Agromyces binzhouensis]